MKTTADSSLATMTTMIMENHDNDKENVPEAAAASTAYSLLVRRRGAFGSRYATDDDQAVSNDDTLASTTTTLPHRHQTSVLEFVEDLPMTDLFDLDDAGGSDDEEQTSDLEDSQELPSDDIVMGERTDPPRQPKVAEDSDSDSEQGDDDESTSVAEAEVKKTETGNHDAIDYDADNAPPSEPKKLTIESLLQSTDILFAGIEDKAAVTVKDVLRALQDEYQLQEAFSKDLRAAVRQRLVQLIQLQQQQQNDKEDDDEEMNDADEESDVGESSDDEEMEHTKSSKPQQIRSKTAKPNARAARKTKTSALRIHADQLRKRRMEELRVRNEEMQAAENEKDKERSEQIAAKFETNTDELRMQRMEQRLGLLHKLDQKRVNIIVQQHKMVADVPTAGDAAKAADAELSDDDDEDDDDMELELIGSNTKMSALRQHTKHTALSLLDMMAKPRNAVSKQIMEQHHSLKPKKSVTRRSPGKSMTARAALKNQLRSKTTKMGNAWLARELGYKTEEEHLKDCRVVEDRKRQRALKIEEERIKLNALRRERMIAHGYIDAGEDDTQHDIVVGDASESPNANVDEEDDEEMAMAKQIEQDEGSVEGDQDFDVEDDEVGNAPAECNDTTTEDETTHISAVDSRQDSLEILDMERFLELSEDKSVAAEPTSPLSRTGSEPSVAQPVMSTDTTAVITGADDGNAEVKDIATERPSKQEGPRNSGWQAMLKKEAEQLKKLKKRKGGGLVEEEADEEEEEAIAGLEDFGFTVKKKGGDDDEFFDDEIDEDDLKHVVDDLSDNEGDEDAGERARLLMEKKEEKERHKEMLRRMRDGYDGRRGGIAVGGAGARGMHRFDQLVAADNREDAKRLGLLNDDELDSDDDEGGEKKAADDEEDEAALLDKMLKDRFLHRSSVTDLEENFSDDEDNMTDENLEANVSGNQDEEEEKEQERLAKRFAKRARMQRLIELHGHEEEFSQSRLIEEDSMIKEELSLMKTGLARKRGQSSNHAPAPTFASTTSKKQKTIGLFGQTVLDKSSLATALQASRRPMNNNKTRTSFLRLAGPTVGGAGGNEVAASFQKSIAFKNVIFQSSDSRSNMSSSRGLGGSNVGATAKTDKRATKAAPGNSLWSKAIASGFQRT